MRKNREKKENAVGEEERGGEGIENAKGEGEEEDNEVKREREKTRER